MFGPLIYHSPLATVIESSDLVKGITGITIGKKTNNNTNLTSRAATKQLHKLNVKGCGRRKYQPDNVKIKITIKNRLMREYGNGSKGEPLECFKVTSLNNKIRK